MADITPWQLLVVDDDEEICRQIEESFAGEPAPGEEGILQVATLTDFDLALERLETHRFDLLILDLRLGSHGHDKALEDEAGIQALQAIKQRLFVPVVFYTGLPGLVRHLETPHIRIVEKTDGLPALEEAIKDIFSTKLPAVNRALIRHVEKVQRDYTWDFVAENWSSFGDATDRTGLAYLLARRLAKSLSAPGIKQLTRDLGDPTGDAVAEGLVHPMEYYIMPPVEEIPALAGDLYHGQARGEDGYWILLTPSCDISQNPKRNKADFVLLAKCLLLSEQPEYQQWRDDMPDPSKTKTNTLKELLKNNRKEGQADRYHFLPGTLSLPHLVVDFQQLVTLPCGTLDDSELKRLASLDSPFAESLLARFTRYFGRLGTPDLDLEHILSGLTSADNLNDE